ncbi:recombination mediator RecR [Crocinitomix catalasitica]|uniref:recombination mediator RecR n=1 Tax=Crocinitomix catalasitica TaxID=184607 RepID=UPI0004829170|nr:recombination mediator RecR [Crocinitomix catalasitica]
MNLPSKHLEELVEHFSSLPGIGKKTALRLVLNLMKRDSDDVKSFANSLDLLHENIASCTNCGNLTDKELCQICLQPNRLNDLVCVVEDIRDIMAIEATQQFSGHYHVLGGVISPMDGIGPADLNIEHLIERLVKGSISEVILALNSSMEGDTTNFYLFRKLSQFPVKVTTLSRGVAVGTELQYADEITLGRSIVNRMPFDFNLVKK